MISITFHDVDLAEIEVGAILKPIARQLIFIAQN
jgi:hypothetical protein